MRRTASKKTERRELPRELLMSAPRPLRLTPGGFTAVLVAVSLAAGAVLGSAALYAAAARGAERRAAIVREGRTVLASVSDVRRGRGKDARETISYRFRVNGKDYEGRTRLRKRDRNRLAIGSTVPVQYLASDPRSNWMGGYAPRAVPYWLAGVTPLLILAIAPIRCALRRQRRLLSEGRPALAHVTQAKKIYGEYGSYWRVSYEWMLLSGARRSGRFDKSAKEPPAPGTPVPILYDRDEPHRHARYPLSLVRIVRD